MSKSDCGNVTDTVLETYHDRESGVKVEKVRRNGYKENQTLLKLYGKRSHTNMTLDGNESDTEYWGKVGEIPAENLSEVLDGLETVIDSQK